MEISSLAVSSLVSFIFRLTVCSAKREIEKNRRVLYPFCISVLPNVLLLLYPSVTNCMATIDPHLTFLWIVLYTSLNYSIYSILSYIRKDKYCPATTPTPPVSRSGYPPWILKWAGPESSGRIPSS